MRIRWIRELFSFSRKERSGIILLLLIIFLLILVGMLIPLLMPKENTNFSAWEGEVNSYLKNTEPKVSKMPEFNLESFDPNRVDSAVLTAIGLPEKLTANWIKYLRRAPLQMVKSPYVEIMPNTVEKLPCRCPRAIQKPGGKVTGRHRRAVRRRGV